MNGRTMLSHHRVFTRSLLTVTALMAAVGCAASPEAPPKSIYESGRNQVRIVKDPESTSNTHPANLTPDRETGLGTWTDAEIITAFTTGMRPDGSQIAPAMPWMSYAHINAEDATALVAYLRSLKPVNHKVPGPFAADAKPTAPYFSVVAPK